MTKLSEFVVPEVVSLEGLLKKLVETVRETNPDPVLFDLGCGKNKAPGFRGVDFYTATDVQHDLFNGDWSFTADDSVDVFYSSHFVEHVPDLNRFMANAWRKLRDGGFFLITTPYGASDRAWQDPTHVRPIFRQTYWYFSKEARDKMNVGHYGSEADFDIVEMWPVFAERFEGLGAAQKEYHLNFTWNSVSDLTALLRARKGREVDHRVDE